MKYNIKSHPTEYNGVSFRSRLEARWAAFFDIVGWEWEYEPIDLTGWSPDFRLVIPCGHSECNGSHSLLVEVKPYSTLEEFKDHQCLEYPFGGYAKEDGGKGFIPADASAAFGLNPHVTYWEMSHGAGGGAESISGWIEGSVIDIGWAEAGAITQWKPKTQEQIVRHETRRSGSPFVQFYLSEQGSGYQERALLAGVGDIYDDAVKDVLSAFELNEITLQNVLEKKACLIAIHRIIDRFEQTQTLKGTV